MSHQTTDSLTIAIKMPFIKDSRKTNNKKMKNNSKKANRIPEISIKFIMSQFSIRENHLICVKIFKLKFEMFFKCGLPINRIV